MCIPGQGTALGSPGAKRRTWNPGTGLTGVAQMQWAAKGRKALNLRVVDRPQGAGEPLSSEKPLEWLDYSDGWTKAWRLDWRKAWMEVWRPITQNTTTTAEHLCHLHNASHENCIWHQKSMSFSLWHLWGPGERKVHSYIKSIVFLDPKLNFVLQFDPIFNDQNLSWSRKYF